MTHKFTTEPWQNLLPLSYNWLKNDLQVKFLDAANTTTADLTVVACKEGQNTDPAKCISKCSDSANIETILKKNHWNANSSSLAFLVADKAYVALGTSKVPTTKPQLSRQWGLDIAKEIKDRSIKSLGIYLPEHLNGLDVLEGLCMGFYDSPKLKSKSSPINFPKEIFFYNEENSETKIKKTIAMAKAITVTRFLQDAPPNWLDTEMFATIASDLSKELGIECKIYGEKELAEEKMHLFLSVSRGSVVPAQMIVMKVKGQNSSKTRALVGKGLTFDSGGISLKPSASMTDMKYDMSGGAAVFGSMYYLSQVTPPTDVVGVIACAENMPSAHATKPSDLIKARNGKTVEILNTDAEGRLVLADALHFTSTTYNPEFMLDTATLTGAVIQALGHNGGAVLSNDNELAKKILNISQELGEPFWQLPLWPEMDKDIKGDFGDLMNIAKPGVMAGTIIGGLFLKEFVEKTPWVHLDIAGVAWDCKATGNPSGGTAYSIRTMTGACLLET